MICRSVASLSLEAGIFRARCLGILASTVLLLGCENAQPTATPLFDQESLAIVTVAHRAFVYDAPYAVEGITATHKIVTDFGALDLAELPSHTAGVLAIMTVVTPELEALQKSICLSGGRQIGESKQGRHDAQALRSVITYFNCRSLF